MTFEEWWEQNTMTVPDAYGIEFWKEKCRDAWEEGRESGRDYEQRQEKYRGKYK